MIRFAAPEWWMLALLLLVVGFAWRRLALWLPLRAVCLALLVLALMQPQVRRLSQGMDLWVLVDRSASAADGMAARLGEWETLLERSKGPDDRLFYVDYADVPVVRGEGTGDYSESAQATRTQLAIRHALSQMTSGRAARLLALTDGYSTEPLGTSANGWYASGSAWITGSSRCRSPRTTASPTCACPPARNRASRSSSNST